MKQSYRPIYILIGLLLLAFVLFFIAQKDLPTTGQIIRSTSGSVVGSFNDDQGFAEDDDDEQPVDCEGANPDHEPKRCNEPDDDKCAENQICNKATCKCEDKPAPQLPGCYCPDRGNPTFIDNCKDESGGPKMDKDQCLGNKDEDIPKSICSFFDFYADPPRIELEDCKFYTNCKCDRPDGDNWRLVHDGCGLGAKTNCGENRCEYRRGNERRYPPCIPDDGGGDTS